MPGASPSSKLTHRTSSSRLSSACRARLCFPHLRFPSPLFLSPLANEPTWRGGQRYLQLSVAMIMSLGTSSVVIGHANVSFVIVSILGTKLPDAIPLLERLTRSSWHMCFAKRTHLRSRQPFPFSSLLTYHRFGALHEASRLPFSCANCPQLLAWS